MRGARRPGKWVRLRQPVLPGVRTLITASTPCVTHHFPAESSVGRRAPSAARSASPTIRNAGKWWDSFHSAYPTELLSKFLTLRQASSQPVSSRPVSSPSEVGRASPRCGGQSRSWAPLPGPSSGSAMPCSLLCSRQGDLGLEELGLLDLVAGNAGGLQGLVQRGVGLVGLARAHQSAASARAALN